MSPGTYQLDVALHSHCPCNPWYTWVTRNTPSRRRRDQCGHRSCSTLHTAIIQWNHIALKYWMRLSVACKRRLMTMIGSFYIATSTDASKFYLESTTIQYGSNVWRLNSHKPKSAHSWLPAANKHILPSNTIFWKFIMFCQSVTQLLKLSKHALELTNQVCEKT